jgi:putative transposase
MHLSENVAVVYIRRLMKLMDLQAIYPQRNLTKRAKGEYRYPYLLRNIEITRPNQVWSIDISYIAMKSGFMYLTAIIDTYSRFIVGWNVGNSLDASVSLEVLKMAIARYGRPEIINSDQGCQYTSATWVEYLQSKEAPENAIRISMDSRGRATDNYWIERFWRTIKRGYVYLNPAADGIELYRGVKKYIEYYNYSRGHVAHDGLAPYVAYCKTESEKGESSTKALLLPKQPQNAARIQII